MSDQRVFSLYEARDWFRDHPKGHVHCVRKRDCAEMYCMTYFEARCFYAEEIEDLKINLRYERERYKASRSRFY